MNFSLTHEVSFDLMKKFRDTSKLSSYLNDELKQESYTNLEDCLINLHCINPRNFPNAKQFHTGYVLDRKYVISKKSLIYTVKIKYEDIENTDDLKSSIVKALKGSVDSINELAIPDFDMSLLVNDIAELLESGGEIKSSNELENVPVVFTPEEKKPVIEKDLMPESDFWKLVDEAQNEALFNDRITFLINQLAALSTEQQYGFELRLRTLLQESITIMC